MEEFAAELIADTRWEVVDDTVLLCPEGCRVEWDGECEHGESPIRALGLI